MKRLALLSILAVALPSCSGGSSALPGNTAVAPPAIAHRAPAAAPAPDRKHRKLVKVKIRIRVPHPHRGMKRALFLRDGLAANTQGVQVVANGPGSASTTTAGDISPGSSNCTPVGTGRTCTFVVAAPPGSDTFIFTTWDQKPVGGSIPASASELGAGLAHPTIVEGTANAPVGVTLGGVVAKVNLAVTPQSMHTLVAATATLQVFAYDADGDAIVGSYVNPNGGAINLNLSVNSTPNCCSQIALSTASLSAPSPNGVGVTYTGNGTNDGNTQVITAAPSGGPAASATVSLNLVDPTFNRVSDGNLNAQGPFFDGMVYDPATTSVVYTFNTGTGGVGVYNVSTSTLSDVSAPGTDPVNGGIAYNGSSLVVAGPNNVYNFAAGAFSAAAGCAVSACTGGSGSGMGVDAGNNVYFGNGTTLVKYTGAATATFLVGGTPSFGMSVDTQAPPNLWIANASAGANVLIFNTTTHATTSLSMPSSNARPFDVMTDAAGMIWVTDRSANQIVEINPAAGGTVANTYGLPYGSPWYIVQDPLQPNIYWYSFLDGYNAGVGRLDTSTGAMTQAHDYCCSAQPGALVELNGIIYMQLDGASYFDVITP